MIRRFSIQATLSILTVSLLVPSALLFYPLGARAESSGCAAQVAGVVAAIPALALFEKSVGVTESAPSLTATGVISAGSQYGTFFERCVLLPLAQKLGKAMLQNITGSIVNWINNGFHGNPSFVQDLHGLISDTTDQAIGQFIQDDLGAGFLCNSFSLQVKVALAQTYLPYRQRSACTLDQISRNVSGFVQNDNSGGWNNWLQVTTVPQNNVYGATVLAQNELSQQITTRLGIQNRELDWGKGFRSWSVCTVAIDPVTGQNDGALAATLSPSDPKCRSSEVRTPGSVVENQLEAALGSGVRQLEVANDLDAIVGALTNQLMSKVITGAQGLLGAGKSSGGSNGGSVGGSVGYTQALSGNVPDKTLQNAIDKGINTISTDSNLSAIFSTDQGTAAPIATTTDMSGNQTPAATQAAVQGLHFSTSQTTTSVNGNTPLMYFTNLVSGASQSGLTVRTTLKSGNGQPVPFLYPFVSFQISYGRTDGTIVTKYISSNTDASAAWSNVSVDPNVPFALQFRGFRSGSGSAPAGSFILETVVTDESGNVVLTNDFNFNVQ